MNRNRSRTRHRPRPTWAARAVVILLIVLLAPALPLLVLRWLPAPTSSFMLQAVHGGVGDADACRQIAYRWTPWRRIADDAKVAVIASEDQRFADHWGLDLESIGSALEEGGDGGRLRGASTISQQVIKNLFLWPGRSWLRKGIEAYLTVMMEMLWSKQRILEVYLNIAQFGPCTFGVAAASKSYFGIAPAELGPRRAALLAAVLPNPGALRADRPSAYVQDRVQWIEAQMRQLGGAGYLQRL